jgi:hypothetical protein
MFTYQSHDKLVARNKRAGHFGLMNLMVVHEPLRFAPYLIEAAHLRRHIFHRARGSTLKMSLGLIPT